MQRCQTEPSSTVIGHAEYHMMPRSFKRSCNRLGAVPWPAHAGKREHGNDEDIHESLRIARWNIGGKHTLQPMFQLMAVRFALPRARRAYDSMIETCADGSPMGSLTSDGNMMSAAFAATFTCLPSRLLHRSRSPYSTTKLS